MQQRSVLDWATQYVAKSLSVIPVKVDGSKAPALRGWTEYQTRLPTATELDQWFGADQHGIGIVCGPASGHLVVLDFECRNGVSAYDQWKQSLPSELIRELVHCPVVVTPSGGRHVWVRLPLSVPGGKLAKYASGSCKIEVRGLGHQVLAPGCPLACHKSGEPYKFENEGWLT